MNLDRIKLIEDVCQFYDQGFSYVSIAQQVGLTKNQIAGILSRHHRERTRRTKTERLWAWKQSRRQRG